MTNEMLTAAQGPYLFSFTCFEEDDTTPLDLTGGDIQLLVQRNGLLPYEVVKTGADTTWEEQSQGKGACVIDLSDAPIGHSRYQLVAQPAERIPIIQAQGWLKIARVWTPTE